MHNVQIRYPQKFLWLKWWRNLVREVPEGWNELTGKQLQDIITVLYSNVPLYQKKIMVWRILLEIKWWLLLAMKDDDVAGFIWMTDFIFEDIKITRNIIPVIKTRFHKFYGPLSELRLIKAAEFMESDKYFLKYTKAVENKEDWSEWLDLFVAVLYRERTSGTKKVDPTRVDIREPFNGNSVEYRAKLIRKVPAAKKLAILNWYRSCRAVWEKMFDQVFSGENSKSAVNYGWFETLKRVSADDFGTMEEKLNVPMFDIFLSMQIDIRDHKKSLERMKSRK